MAPLKVVIVEDDPVHAATLQDALTKLSTHVQLFAVCTNIPDAFEKINQHKPDLIFLDIELDRGENGFDLLKKFPEPDFSVIFTTQHSTSSNMLNALRASALDFLTKAVNSEELENAVNKYNKVKGREQLKTLQENTESPDQRMKVLMIRTTEGLYRIGIDNTRFAASRGAYTTFYLIEPVEGKKEYLTSTRIGVWTETLNQSDMVRCHREWMVNIKHSLRFNKEGKGGYFTMDNGEKVPVSESYRELAEHRFRSFRKQES